MTALLATSILLIAAAAGSLVIGWLTATSPLVWTSIACSIGGGVTLAVAYSRSRAEANALPQPTPVAQSVLVRPGSPDSAQETALFGPGSGMAPEDIGEAVVAIPERRRFHRPECRHSRVDGAVRMSREAAVARDYAACGACKP